MSHSDEGYVWLPLAVKGQLEAVRVMRCMVNGLPKQIERFVSEPYSAGVIRDDKFLKRQTCMSVTFKLTFVVMPNGCRIPIYVEDPKDPNVFKLAEVFWVNSGRPRHLY